MRKVVCIVLIVAVSVFCREARSQGRPPFTTYHSDALNVDFTYPSSFDNKGADESVKNCVSTPIGAMDMRKGFNMIFLRRFDGACVGRDIAAERSTITFNFVNNLLKLLGKPDVNKGPEYEISGHMASLASGTAKVEDAIIHGVGSCAAVNKDLVCFAFLSSDCPTLAALSASTVKFADGTPAAIIPVDVAAPCRSK